MARAGSHKTGNIEGDVRGAANAAPRSSPLRLVEGAVAGDDLQSVARAAAAALSCSVAIALPAFGLSAHWPANFGQPETLAALGKYASALVANRDQPVPPQLAGSIPVRLGGDVVGVVAALDPGAGTPELEPWLHAAAAAAAVTALLRESSGSGLQGARRAFLQMLELHASSDPATLLTQARRLGYDLSAGAIALSAEFPAGAELDLEQLAEEALIADVGSERVLGLIPMRRDGKSPLLSHQLAALKAAGLRHLVSIPRSPAELQEALQEAAVLLELMLEPESHFEAHEETYRLLVGVLIRDPQELEHLRVTTVAALERYDESHETELVATLNTFLLHHGSTTDTADSMRLHRHTVGYRLARVQEVSGHSPYETEGRERLSLGLKASRIMSAECRRTGRVRPA